MAKYNQGKYKPKNPKKYKGDASKIVFRSGWELSCMKYFDSHPDVLQWMSEEIVVPYRSPKDRKIHRYFPDFVIKMRSKSGNIKIKMIEVKPLAQTMPPKKSNNKKRLLTETITYAVNLAKWEAAEKYCKKRGWEFEKMTEKGIFGKKKK